MNGMGRERCRGRSAASSWLRVLASGRRVHLGSVARQHVCVSIRIARGVDEAALPEKASLSICDQKCE